MTITNSALAALIVALALSTLVLSLHIWRLESQYRKENPMASPLEGSVTIKVVPTILNPDEVRGEILNGIYDSGLSICAFETEDLVDAILARLMVVHVEPV